MVRCFLILVATLSCFTANTATTNWEYRKVLDREIRMLYYNQCRLEKGKNCHTVSFNKAVKLEIVNK